MDKWPQGVGRKVQYREKERKLKWGINAASPEDSTINVNLQQRVFVTQKERKER
jgi:hypothetical protein